MVRRNSWDLTNCAGGWAVRCGIRERTGRPRTRRSPLTPASSTMIALAERPRCLSYTLGVHSKGPTTRHQPLFIVRGGGAWARGKGETSGSQPRRVHR